MIEDCGKAGYVCRSTGLPLGVYVSLWSIELFLWNMKEADSRMVGFLDELVPALALVQIPFHVGLARSNPDIADENIFQDDGIPALDGHLVRFAPVGL